MAFGPGVARGGVEVGAGRDRDAGAPRLLRRADRPRTAAPQGFGLWVRLARRLELHEQTAGRVEDRALLRHCPVEAGDNRIVARRREARLVDRGGVLLGGEHTRPRLLA